jgi:glycosyltransferase involved in cell wall biosynthesis
MEPENPVVNLMIKVVHFQRKPRAMGNYSVENYFQTIRELIPLDVKIMLKTSKYESNGVFKRLYNTVEAFFNQGDINHVTGDVHFLTLLLKRKRTILTIHDCGILKNRSYFTFKILKLFWFTLPAKKSSFITVNSEFTKKDLLNYINYDPDKIKVVYVCISNAFKPTPKEFNKTKPVILQIGTAENKNLKRIIPALNGISCRFVILGKLDRKSVV